MRQEVFSNFFFEVFGSPVNCLSYPLIGSRCSLFSRWLCESVRKEGEHAAASSLPFGVVAKGTRSVRMAQEQNRVIPGKRNPFRPCQDSISQPPGRFLGRPCLPPK